MLYPIGQQNFADIRRNGFVYVDKTDLVYKMTHGGKYYFLSRPRRFGKSLLLSTLKNYFLGRKELFQGLAIEQLETEWQQYPVLSLSLSKGKFDSMDDLHSCLRMNFAEMEATYGRNPEEQDYAERFTGNILRAYQQTGKQVVILIDEYDAPLQAALYKPELMEPYQNQLRDIFLCLKKNDEYIRFAFLTGITSWGKLGVFSTLNNLKDISITEEYATLCGITEEELHNVFPEAVTQLAEKHKLTVDEAYQRLKQQYDGYHFANATPGVYNPFSLLRALDEKQFDNFWIQTGETQLIANLAKRINIDIDELLNEVSMPIDNILNPKNYLDSPYTFLYQAGYLTIKERDEIARCYILQVPNAEVRESLAFHLLPSTLGFGALEADTFYRAMLRAVYYMRIEELVELLNDYIFRKGNYMTMGAKERYFQSTLTTVFLLLGYEVQSEVIGHKGRADLVVKTRNPIYIIETKINGSARQALDQINEKGYADAYTTESRPIVKLGLNFSETERIIDDFAVEK